MRKFRLSESKAMLASALQSGRTNGRRPKGKSNFDRRSKTKLLSLLGLLLMAVAQGAWAQTLSTDGSGAYTIGSKADWETFCTDVNGGTTYEGKTVILTADVSGITTRTYNNLGKPFSGTFDGQGHTLNLNINVATADATSAPFGYISGATIKNLHITGSETTAGMRIASIAGFAANSTITNCWSEVALTSSYNKDIDGGAIVARTESGTIVTLNGCVFTGSITYSNAGGYEGGGMVGWRKGTVVLNNCVFAPSAVTVTKYSGHQMFVGNGGGTLNNCYYNDVAAATSLTVQGKQMRSITSGSDGVTISGLGTATATYDVSGITAYSKGVKYDGVCYAGNGEAVTLSIGPAYFVVSECSVTGGGTLANATTSTPTLTMTDADQTITATGSYHMNSKSHWEEFCTAVSSGTTYEGKTIYLDADISGITTRTDDNLYSSKPFSGTFDGQGHTLNLNINVATADATAAPFAYISGATIKDLHITGSETTAGMRIASIAGCAANRTITNCWSEVALTSSYNKDIDGGAFVARVEDNKTLTLNGCVFTGSITYSNAAGYEGGGMVGWTRPGAAATLNNCLFAPSSITITKYSGHYMLVGGKTRGTLNNCYYNAVAAASSLTKEGKQMRSITAGDDVTALAISGAGTEYNVSGITVYVKGIKFGNVLYAANGDAVGLTLNHGDKTGYTFNQYTATGGGTLNAQTETSATLTMTDANQTISAEWTKNELALSEAANNATAISEAAESGKTYVVSLTRTLQQGGWNTFCVPFNLDTPTGWTVKTLTASSFNSGTGELTLTFADAASIEAGKPYLVKVTSTVENPTFEDVTISNSTTTTETASADFVPVMNPTNLTGGDKTVLFVTGGNKLTYPTADGNINAFRAYFQLKGDAVAEARAFRMSFDDDATGIVTVLTDELTTASGIYTLDGRRLQGQPTARSAEGRLYPKGLKKGVYIVNGKKIVVK